MAADSTLNHEYLPVAGLPSLRDAAVKLVLGADSPALVEGRAFGVQVESEWVIDEWTVSGWVIA